MYMCVCSWFRVVVYVSSPVPQNIDRIRLVAVEEVSSERCVFFSGAGSVDGEELRKKVLC